MKKLLTLYAILITAPGLFSQAPQKMSYQCVVRDEGGDLIVNQEIGMRISILLDSETGTMVYAETQTPTTNENGLISIAIGSGTPLTGNFASIKWGSGTYLLKTEIDVNGSANYTIMGISQLLSVPYSLFSNNSYHANLANTADTAKTVSYQSKFLFLVIHSKGDSYEMIYWKADVDGTGREEINFLEPEKLGSALWEMDVSPVLITPDKKYLFLLMQKVRIGLTVQFILNQLTDLTLRNYLHWSLWIWRAVLRYI